MTHEILPLTTNKLDDLTLTRAASYLLHALADHPTMSIADQERLLTEGAEPPVSEMMAIRIRNAVCYRINDLAGNARRERSIDDLIAIVDKNACIQSGIMS